MLGLKNLRGDTEADIAGLLDSTVNVDVAVIDDENHKPRHSVVAVAGLVPRLGDCELSVIE